MSHASSKPVSGIPPRTDVLVVGAGMAGYAAAISAAELGADVLLVEKEELDGGSSILAGASFAFAGTKAQADAGIEDDIETLRKDLLDVGGYKNNPEILELYLDHQLETYDWLRSVGVRFQDVQLSSNMSRPRSHPAVPAQIFEALRARAANFPNLVRLVGRGMTGLTFEPGSGCVTGGKIRDADGAEHEVRADRGVVLATGGFARSRDLVQTFAPEQAPAIRLGGTGSDGDGLRMAWALGADMADMGYVKATFGIAMPDHPLEQRAYDGPRPLVHAMYRGGLIVNTESRRFISEANSYKVLGEACLRQSGAAAYQIFDQRVMDESREAPRTHDYRGALEAGLIHRGETLAEAAAKAGLDPDRVEQEVGLYNAAVAGQGADAFGRETLGMGVGTPRPVDQPAFYVFPCTSGLFSTYAGLKTDAGLQVRKVDGGVLTGLYAAGEVMGGFHGKGYMSGTGMGKSAVFGRLAGRLAASSRP
ncbi:FAD-dependent oxidoreductase [Oceanicola sp. 502str15]|uniref:FAD-dependent oxidoreductase n=1 Tax=Oceanicola sp. 502str15 TaxID=2696061 RepID=UPI00209607E5|nr:FAD-dependent oxidoreductase [Oceanicola sp. 502str15]MCO6385294.1 FAD-binding protein [Oceanicola sp. 502str15]